MKEHIGRLTQGTEAQIALERLRRIKAELVPEQAIPYCLKAEETTLTLQHMQVMLAGPAKGSSNPPRASSSKHTQRVPRRDWTADERAKRDERTHGIVSAASSARLAGSRAVFTGSAENSSGEEAFQSDARGSLEDEETTALPRFTPQQQAQIIAQHVAVICLKGFIFSFIFSSSYPVYICVVLMATHPVNICF